LIQCLQVLNQPARIDESNQLFAQRLGKSDSSGDQAKP
jgi:hypothetical protein